MGAPRVRRNRAAAAFALALGLTACAAEPAPPPIVFISIDTLTARHLSLYGYERETSPALDAFAAEAVVFEHCWANSTWTVPSYMSQFTGLFPWAHRTDPELGSDGLVLAPERATLAEVFGEAGYRTAAFIDNPNMAASFGFDQGFEVYDDSAARVPKRDHAGGARKVFRDGLAWLDALEDDEPYLLFLQALDVHGPYVPEAPWDGSLAGDGRGVGEDVEARVARTPNVVFDAVPTYIARPEFPGEQPPARMPLAGLVDAYDEEILQIDAALDELFDALRERGVLDEAIVVISADHGESLVEHSTLFQHAMPYEPVLHVPLIVRMPGGGEGARVDAPVQLVDLFPTLIDVAGIDAETAHLHGRSLAPALHGRTVEPRPLICQSDLFDGQAAFSDGVKVIELLPHPRFGAEAFGSYPPVRDWLAERYPELADVVIGTDDMTGERAARLGSGKLWVDAQAELCVTRHEVYRLDDDPDELRDLARAADGEAPNDLRDSVEALVRELERARALADRARIEGASAPDPDAMDDELMRELAGLGYTDD